MDKKLDELRELAKRAHEAHNTTSVESEVPRPVFVPTGSVEVIDYAPISTQQATADYNPTPNQKITTKQKIFGIIKKYPWALPVIALLLTTLIGLSLWMVFNKAPKVVHNNVLTVVTAPKEAPIGSTREWTITVTNNNPVQIFDTRVALLTDQNFKYQRDTTGGALFDQKSTTYFLKEIEAGGVRIIRFEAQILGAIGETSTFQARTTFTPQSTQGQASYEVLSDKKVTTIVSSDITAEVIKEKDLVEVNSDVSVIFKFENVSDKDIENIRIRGIFPVDADFFYRSSQLDQGSLGIDTTPSEGNNTWIIPKLPKKAIFQLKVNGTIQSSAKTELPFVFEVASLSIDKEWKKILEKSDTIRSTPQSLAVTTSISGVQEFFKPGDVLQFVTELENKSTKSLSSLELKSTINDPAGLLDYSKIQITSGTPNLTDKTLIWKGANLADLVSLAPGAKIAIKYSVPVKTTELALNSNFTQESYTIQPVVEVNQPDKPSITAASSVVYKMHGGMTFKQTAEEIADVSQTVFSGDTGVFKVTRVTWELSTLQNSLKELEIKSSTSITSLFEPVFNPMSITPADYLDKLLYADTGDIVLRQDFVDAYLGVSKSKFIITFDIKLPENAAINGNYGSIVVLNKTTATATDSVTGQQYKFEIPAFNFASLKK